MPLLRSVGRTLGTGLEALNVILYHLLLCGAVALGVWLTPASAALGIGLIAVAVILAVVFWTTGWMFFPG